MKITHIIAGIIISALSCLFSDLSAQSRALSGSVRDTDGNPVAEAVVTDGFTQSVTEITGLNLHILKGSVSCQSEFHPDICRL